MGRVVAFEKDPSGKVNRVFVKYSPLVIYASEVDVFANFLKNKLLSLFFPTNMLLKFFLLFLPVWNSLEGLIFFVGMG